MPYCSYASAVQVKNRGFSFLIKIVISWVIHKNLIVFAADSGSDNPVMSTNTVYNL